jgi:hypothetical protein
MMDIPMPILSVLDSAREIKKEFQANVLCHGSAKNGCRGYRSWAQYFNVKHSDEGMVLDDIKTALD